MKRVSITRFFLIIIIIFALLIGGAAAFIMINPNVLGLLSSGDRITISTADYEYLINTYNKYSKVEDVWKRLEKEFYTDVDEDALQIGMIKGLVAGTGDLYSGYYSEQEYEDLLVSLTGEYDGVGITMVQSEHGYIEVQAVTKDSPAEAGGVQIGEYITKVDGKAYTSDTMDAAAAAVRGKAGTNVKITFLSNGAEIERTFTRAHITSKTVEYSILDDNIAYIKISSFENSTTDDFKKALSAVGSADALILDLRDNPGGLVDSAVDIADMFMDSATLVYTEDRDGNREYKKTKAGKAWNKNFVVLVNENSASASEIFAAGIQDNDVAMLVGTTTFGKGIIQELEQFKDGDALKLTKWQYFTPSGRQIHKAGVRPEIIVDDPEEQLTRAIELVKQ